jgi:hypothetical protein
MDEEYGMKSEYEKDEQELELSMEEPESPDAMDEEQFGAVVKAAIDDAENYIDDYIAPRRELSMSYYRGDFLGNEEEGRSQVVMTEVRDTVQAMMPSLLRIFTASENAVEFAPRSPEDVLGAQQATDTVNYVFYSENPGFQILYDGIKDALISKTGIFKWRAEEIKSVSESEYTGLDAEQYALLVSDPDNEVIEVSVKYVEQTVSDPMTGAPMSSAQETYEVKVRRTKKGLKYIVQCIPPEEFLIARNARDLDTADYVGHRKLATVSELVAMGYDKDEVEQYGGQGDTFDINTEAQVRNPAILSFLNNADNPDKTLERVFYVESYIRVDKDGDGIAELRRVCTIGNGTHILHDEVVDEVPFAVICPDPTPHMVIGESISDQVMDLQIIKTNVVRNTLDSLAQVIHPRTVVVEGQVNMDDVMNVETGGIIRARQPGMVQSLSEPFVGMQAMPIINYLDDLRASRTGISKASQGLDANVLQSTTKAAVVATMSSAEQRLEMIARIFAETGIKRLFKGLLKMIIKNQDKPMVIRLRNQWIPVDPRNWNPDMDMIVNVGLGNGNASERTMLLNMILQKQEQALMQFGPDNPLVDLKQYRDTITQILAINGMKDGSKYFKEIDRQSLPQLQQASMGQPKPDPTEMLAQVEMEKVKADIQIAQLKAQLDIEKTRMEDDRERDKTDVDMMLRAAEIEAKYGTQVNVAAIKAEMERDRDALRLLSQQAMANRGMGGV